MIHNPPTAQGYSDQGDSLRPHLPVAQYYQSHDLDVTVDDKSTSAIVPRDDLIVLQAIRECRRKILRAWRLTTRLGFGCLSRAIGGTSRCDQQVGDEGTDGN